MDATALLPVLGLRPPTIVSAIHGLIARSSSGQSFGVSFREVPALACSAGPPGDRMDGLEEDLAVPRMRRSTPSPAGGPGHGTGPDLPKQIKAHRSG